MELKILNSEGKQVGTQKLNESFFGVAKKDYTVSDVVRMQAANERLGLAHTKTRSEINVSKRKPWRQKGTGRARAGSANSPLWVGGGTVFGPRKRSYAYAMPRRAHKLALAAILSEKQKAGRLIAWSQWSGLQGPKTSVALAILEKFGLLKKTSRPGVPENRKFFERTIIVLPDWDKDEAGEEILDSGKKLAAQKQFQVVRKSFDNLEHARVVKVSCVHAADLLHYDNVVVAADAFGQLERKIAI